MPKYGMTSRVEHETELVLEKIFDAPREKVFEMFTDSKHLEHFWGPRGWELIYSEINFKPEGEWLYGMKSTDESQQTYGMESWGKAIFLEIKAPEKIIYEDYFADKTGEVDREMPVAKSVTEFHALNDSRTILVNRTTYETAEELQELRDGGMMEGIAETWDRLSDYLEEVK